MPIMGIDRYCCTVINQYLHLQAKICYIVEFSWLGQFIFKLVVVLVGVNVNLHGPS